MISLNINHAALQRVGMHKARTLVTRVTRQTLNRSAVLCPVDTGRLRASGSMRVADIGQQVRGQVEYDAKYAAAVHNGSLPRIITPTRKRALKFNVDGRVVYARRVVHPGTRAKPFLTTALGEVAPRQGFKVNVTMRRR